ncbi:MAG: 3-deoxy-8-phosphooctulonate synthase [Opitutaceae bacterium]|nr:3-deoxy-8-phosphooctulonate synthase [Verrucomicrobiales bacterium]
MQLLCDVVVAVFVEDSDDGAKTLGVLNGAADLLEAPGKHGAVTVASGRLARQVGFPTALSRRIYINSPSCYNHGVSTASSVWKALNRSNRLVLIAGPCVIESEELCLKIGTSLKKTCERLGITYVFKASYDKANRSSGKSFRGPGLAEGLTILGRIREKLRVPVLTDIHTESQAYEAGEVVDILQIPAFLCRQTDLIQAAVCTGKIVNIKKGQFLSPQEMVNVVRKAREAAGEHIMLTERGTTFGYNNLVADMRSIPILKKLGCPVIFDATHSVQLPGGGGDKSSGQREFAPVLANCAVAAGADGVFIETHPDPDKALSDGPNMVPLAEMARLLSTLVKIHAAIR